jgi:ketosteroid isomerase-like protein
MPEETGSDRDRAVAFVQAYGRAWEEWDYRGFVDLFTDDVVYVAHATDKRVVGRAELADYIQEEADDQGDARVRMGRPVIDGDRVAAEFWVTRSNEGQDWTTAGCLIARLGPDGRCSFFREYWFDVQGHSNAYRGWGE